MLALPVELSRSDLAAVWFSNLSSASIICSGVFILACLTDYLDGYLARRMVREVTGAGGCASDCTLYLSHDNPSIAMKHACATLQGTTSAFGAFLDPVADKLMVATVLILLATEPLKGGPWAGNTWLLPSLSSGVMTASAG